PHQEKETLPVTACQVPVPATSRSVSKGGSYPSLTLRVPKATSPLPPSTRSMIRDNGNDVEPDAGRQRLERHGGGQGRAARGGACHVHPLAGITRGPFPMARPAAAPARHRPRRGQPNPTAGLRRGAEPLHRQPTSQAGQEGRRNRTEPAAVIE